jgi:type IX secretion system substrate protein
MKKHILLFFIPLLLLSVSGKSQSVLGIGQLSYVINNDTLPAYSTDSIDLWVINYSSSAFNDKIVLFTAVQDSAGASFHFVDTSGTAPVFIAPSDSIPVTIFPLYETYDTTKYHFDINVIVIWPVAFTGTTTVVDSLHYIQFITVASSVNEISLDRLIKAFPNPVHNNLNIENTSKNAIEEVRIYDMFGRLVHTEKNPTVICTDTWTKGTYLISITLENKQTHTIRIIRQ